jgi:hypothetical protein
MSERPTAEEVKVALMVTRPGAAIGPNVACVLAAEVRALREELAKAEEFLDGFSAMCTEQEATIVRVEAFAARALPENLRELLQQALRGPT